MAQCHSCHADVPEEVPFCVHCGAEVIAAGLPEVIGDRYEVRAVLGQGGMGSVLKVFDRRRGDEVALKLLHAERAADATATERWRREVDAISRVRHPNLIEVLDQGTATTTPPRPYFVMPLLHGQSLEQVAESGAIPPARAAQIVRALLAAVTALHQAGWVHRDLKASNVFLCSGDVPILLDLGIVRPMAADANLTVRGEVVGSLEALAPEQIQGGPIDARTDVYQAGALLLRLVLGRPAFDAESTQSWFAAHAGGAGLSGRVADIPEALSRVCLRAMAIAPEERYPTAVEMAAALERALGSGRRGLFGWLTRRR
jgi:serine/threonine-protein kinase